MSAVQAAAHMLPDHESDAKVRMQDLYKNLICGVVLALTQAATAFAVFCGSSGSSGGGARDVFTAQKRQPLR